MKKIILLLLISMLSISLVACGSQSDVGASSSDVMIYEVGDKKEDVFLNLAVEGNVFSHSDTINITSAALNDGQKTIEYTRFNGCDTGIHVEIKGEGGEKLLTDERVKGEEKACTEAIYQEELKPDHKVEVKHIFQPKVINGSNMAEAPKGKYMIKATFQLGTTEEVEDKAFSVEFPIEIK
jgi:uncharacterized protein YcfL